MDQSELAKLVEELNLTKEASENVIEVPTTDIARATNQTNFGRFVVGKIFASRVVNRETLRIHLPRILQIRSEVDIEIVGDNVFVVVFSNERERSYALHEGPWHFFDNLMLFKEPKGLEKPSDIKFEEYMTWVQCHNLPLACMNPISLRRIGEVIGTVVEIDEGERGNCIGQYGRIRVMRQIERPLQRSVKVKGDERHLPQTVILCYERLPEFCNACGRVGDTMIHCNDDKADKKKVAFGPWLKATRTMEYRRNRSGSYGATSPRPQERRIETNMKLVQHEEEKEKEEGTDPQDGRGAELVAIEEVQRVGGLNDKNPNKQRVQTERIEGAANTTGKTEGEESCEGGREEGLDKWNKEEVRTTYKKGATKTEVARWKRRVRMEKAEQERISSDQDMDVETNVITGRKREARNEEIEVFTPIRKQICLREETDINQETMAAAAEQPHRSQ